jgi:hypothetical protein
MKSKVLTVMMALVVSTSANAQFGGLGGLMGGGGGGGGDVGAQVLVFNQEANLISKTVAFALIQIVGALGDKTKIADIKAVNDSLSKSTDTKEIGAISGSVIKSNFAEADQLLKSADAKAKMENLSPEMQKKVAQSIFAVGVAALQIPGAINRGKNIVSSVGANPMNIVKVLPVKDGLSMYIDVLPKLPTLVTTGMQLMRDVKVEAGNPTADAKLAPESASFPES